jgi:hypothetical protein
MCLVNVVTNGRTQEAWGRFIDPVPQGRRNVSVIVVVVTHVMATIANVEGSQEATARRMRTVNLL